MSGYYGAMLDRIAEYKANPPLNFRGEPDKDWDGVYRATSKQEIVMFEHRKYHALYFILGFILAGMLVVWVG